MTAGYAGTPLAKKLGIKSGQTLLSVAAPPRWAIQDLPDGVRVRRRINAGRAEVGTADVVVAFFTTARQIGRSAVALALGLGSDSALWIAWPRRAGGHSSDITDHVVRETLLPVGVVDVKVAALDEDWSALKFVWRVENREGRRRAREVKPGRAPAS
jgi:hypothetical protein